MPDLDIVSGPWGSVKDMIYSEQVQSFADTMETFQSIASASLNSILGDCLLNTAGLAIGSTKTKVAHGAVNYVINGMTYTLPANAVGVTLDAVTVPQNTYGAWAFDVGADGVVDVWPGVDNATGYASANVAIYACPNPAPDHIRLGVLTCASSAAAGFIAGTTELDAAAVTEVYRNNAALKTGLISSPRMGEDDGTANVAEIFSAFTYMINGVVYNKALAAGIALTNGVVTKAAKFGAYRFFIDSAGTVTFQSAPSSLVDSAQKQNYSTEAEALAAINLMPPIGATCPIATLIITTAASDFTPATTDIGAADVTDTWYDGKYVLEKLFA
jgi:hypothetical protein